MGQQPSGAARCNVAPGPANDFYPAEGQESIVWYDQLFSDSFSAIENPFLAAAQFDSAIDPTWSYLR